MAADRDRARLGGVMNECVELLHSRGALVTGLVQGRDGADRGWAEEEGQG